MQKHYLKQIETTQQSNTVEAVYGEMEQLFNQHHRLLVLMDETLVPNAFDDLKQNLNSDNIIYLPLALGNNYKDTCLFFIEINHINVFKSIGQELAEHIVSNFKVENDQYLVHGFGTTDLSNNELNKRFKKSLVINDIESKILFRWYDPRVMIYLDAIFNESYMNSLLGMFSSWRFVHPTGHFHWEKTLEKKWTSYSIRKINPQQSLALDLVEIANLVFRKSNELEQIDQNTVKPKLILNNLYQAHEQYQITGYADLVAYGLYAEILGRHFMKHPYVESVLKQCWKTEPENYNFTEAMDFIAEEYWTSLKNDLNLFTDHHHGK